MWWMKIEPNKAEDIKKIIGSLNDNRIIDTLNMPHVDIKTLHKTLHMDAYECVGGMVCAWLKDHYGYNRDCLVKMKLWYPTDEEPSIITSLWMANSSDYWFGEWLDDWWEGHTRVEIIGILPLREVDVPENHHAVWMDEKICSD